MVNTANSKKPDYGLDAPGVIRNLLIIGLALVILSFALPPLTIGRAVIPFWWFIIPGSVFTIEGVLMLMYSLHGKFAHRDRMLAMVNWRGDEQVLDVGTGGGLLMIGAAKKLSTGKSIGIDIWNEQDLSSNNIDNALNNAEIEGVKDKIEIKNEHASHMSFGKNSFDIVLSNLCIHNIYDGRGRYDACMEIGNVLKPGGTAIISDFKHIKEYRLAFNGIGLETVVHPANYLTTFPPLKILVVKKK